MVKREIKPYDKCLRCERFGVECDGPRTAAMANDRWCEWLTAVKKMRGITNAFIADTAGVSIATVERITSGKPPKDLFRSTATAIENAIVGSSNQYPCYLAFLESVPNHSRTALEMEEEMAELRHNIALIHASYKEELETVRRDAQAKIDYLKAENERKDRIINKLLEK